MSKRWWYVGSLAPKPEPVTVGIDFGPLNYDSRDSNGNTYESANHVHGTEADAWRRIRDHAARDAPRWPKWIENLEAKKRRATLNLAVALWDRTRDERRLADAIRWLEEDDSNGR